MNLQQPFPKFLPFFASFPRYEENPTGIGRRGSLDGGHSRSTAISDGSGTGGFWLDHTL
ncbi:MAG: hypothetical protein JWL84_4266 [Rhodospirillales bacterium]|nr:hypothetical protein [Rhodospirillales bacterium]